MEKTFEQKLATRIAEAQKETDKAKEKAMDKLLDNTSFIETQRTMTEKIIQLNAISPYVAKGGRKFSINVFKASIFGIGMESVMGILIGSRGAFADEKMLEYSAITGISMLELSTAQSAIGSPAYFKDGKVFDAIPGDYPELKALLEGIFLKLRLSEFKSTDISRDKFNLYFALAETRAHKQLTESEELKTLEENSTDFVMED